MWSRAGLAGKVGRYHAAFAGPPYSKPSLLHTPPHPPLSATSRPSGRRRRRRRPSRAIPPPSSRRRHHSYLAALCRPPRPQLAAVLPVALSWRSTSLDDTTPKHALCFAEALSSSHETLYRCRRSKSSSFSQRCRFRRQLDAALGFISAKIGQAPSPALQTLRANHHHGSANTHVNLGASW